MKFDWTLALSKPKCEQTPKERIEFFVGIPAWLYAIMPRAGTHLTARAGAVSITRASVLRWAIQCGLHTPPQEVKLAFAVSSVRGDPQYQVSVKLNSAMYWQVAVWAKLALISRMSTALRTLLACGLGLVNRTTKGVISRPHLRTAESYIQYASQLTEQQCLILYDRAVALGLPYVFPAHSPTRSTTSAAGESVRCLADV